MPVNAFYGSKVLISGGLGFIGSNLAIRLVEAGAKVTIVDSLIPDYGGNLFNVESVRNRLHINFSDVRDRHSLHYLVAEQDYFFNLAGQTSHLDSMRNPFTDLEINARAQLSILETCHVYNPQIKIVFASTRQVYGKPEYNPVDEKHPLNPVDINGINKLAGEWYHIIYNNVYNIPTTVLRLTNTYGPRMRIKDTRQTFLGIWIRNLIENRPITIYGMGNQLRDYNYIEDVVGALLLVAVVDEHKGSIYNLGSSEPMSLKQTAEAMVAMNGGGTIDFKPFPPELLKIDIGDYFSNYNKIRNELAWSPSTSFGDGMSKTIEYYKQNLDKYL